MTGPRSRAAVARGVLESERFGQQMALLADRLGRPLPQVRREAHAGLRALVTVQSPLFGLLCSTGCWCRRTPAP